MQRDVVAFSSAGERSVRLTCSRLANRRHAVSVEGFDEEVEGVGVDAFAALEKVRRRLESAGWLLAVQGGRRNAFASGLQRDMHGGIRAYICEMGRWPARESLVDIFASARREDVTTVAEQQEWHGAWRESLPESRK